MHARCALHARTFCSSDFVSIENKGSKIHIPKVGGRSRPALPSFTFQRLRERYKRRRPWKSRPLRATRERTAEHVAISGQGHLAGALCFTADWLSPIPCAPVSQPYLLPCLLLLLARRGTRRTSFRH